MARYGFDLDITLTDYPEVAHLARALGREGHKLIIVTASGADKKVLYAKLYALNVVEGVHKLIKVNGETDEEIGRNKGEACNKHKVSVYFDDNAAVLGGFGLTSKITCVLVMPANEGHEPEKQPVRDTSVGCPCLLYSSQPARCFHCPTFLATPEEDRAHSRMHHETAETRLTDDRIT